MRIEIIDIVIAVLILYSIFRGYHLGLIRQIGALGGILLAILGANLLSPFMGLLLNKTELFPEYVNHKIAYLVTFLIILFFITQGVRSERYKNARKFILLFRNNKSRSFYSRFI